MARLFLPPVQEFFGYRIYCLKVPAVDVRQWCVAQRVHQRGGVTDFACILEGLISVCEGGIWKAKQPQGQRLIAKIATLMSWPKRVASGRCSSGIIKRKGVMQMRSPLRDVARIH